MKLKIRLTRLAFVALILLSFLITVNGQDEKPLTKEEQKEFLAQRTDTVRLNGTLNSVIKSLYTFWNVVIHSDLKEIGQIKLASPFPSFYKPTWAEIFDTIATQTETSYSYDSSKSYWLFSKPSKPLYTINIADGWTSANSGIYVGYKPPAYPVGMDIYQFGTYSDDDKRKEAALFERVRNDLALRLVKDFKSEVSIDSMDRVRVDGVESLYFESPAPQKNVIWRQWALVKNGKAFVIVSALESKDKKLLADVQAMVKSFHVN